MKVMIFGVLLICVMNLDSLLFAQPDPWVSQELERVCHTLDLSEEKQGELRLILENHHREMRRIRELNQGDLRAQENANQAQREILDQQLKNILTAEQFEQYKNVIINNNFSRQTQELKRVLQLSDSQAVRVNQIMVATHQKMNALKEESSGDRHQMREGMIQLMEEHDKKIEALLSDDQKKQYQQYKKERQERMRREGPPGAKRPR